MLKIPDNNIPEETLTLDAAPIPLFCLDSNRIVKHVNETAISRLGYPIELIQQAPFHRFFALYSPSMDELERRAVQDASSLESDAVMMSYHREVPVHLLVRPLVNDGQKYWVVGVVDCGVVHQLQKRNDDTSKMLQELTYAISHDLRSPLRKLQAFYELLKEAVEHAADKSTNFYLQAIGSNASCLQDLLKDLLDYSRTFTSSERHVFVDTCDLVRQVLSLHQEPVLAGEADVRFSDLPTIYTKPQLFARLIQELVDNALKFGGRDCIEVSIQAEEREHEWAFWVRDNGVGIAPAFRSNVFGIFQKYHPTEKSSGNGIGLALCQQIVRHLDGTIWLEDSEEEGTTVGFTLPRPLLKVCPS